MISVNCSKSIHYNDLSVLNFESDDYWKINADKTLSYDGKADLFDEDGNLLLSGVDGDIWKSLVKYMGADAANSMLGGDGSMSLDEMAAGLLGMYNTAGQYSPMAALPTFGVRDELSGLAIGAEAIWERKVSRRTTDLLFRKEKSQKIHLPMWNFQS